MKTNISNTEPPSHVRYSELLASGREQLAGAGRGAGQVANYQTALNKWRAFHGRDAEAEVLHDFGQSFPEMLDRFIESAAESISGRTLKDRLEQLEWWRRLAGQLSLDDTLPALFADALRVAYKRSGRTRAALCAEAGLSLESMKRWLAEKGMPERNTIPQVLLLEQALGLPAETLVRRMPKRRQDNRASSAAPQTSFGQRLSRNFQRAEKEGIRKFALAATERMKDQWTELLRYKTDRSKPGARPRNTWNLKPRHQVGVRCYWYMLLDDMVCPSAGVDYPMVARFLGFLALPVRLGGKAMPSHGLDTLAWFTRADLAIAYVKWMRSRSAGLRHNGLFNFLQLAASLLRAKTGYIWRNPELARTLPESEWVPNDPASNSDAWHRRCEQAHDQVRSYENSLKAEGKLQHSRAPEESLAEFVMSDFPLRELLRLVTAIEEDEPPIRQRRNHAVWTRDVLMLNLLMRHPLRVNNISTLRLTGPRPHLTRVGTGWHLHVPQEELKNWYSLEATDYDVNLVPELAQLLNRYLAEGRPELRGADSSDFLFLPSQGGGPARLPDNQQEGEEQGAWDTHGIYLRVRELTKRYSINGFGLNPHASRHIVVKDHLLRNPREYVVAARILNDSLQTVVRNYGRLEIGDGARVVSDSLEKAKGELRLGR